MELHYRYIHTNSVVVPIEVAKDIIRNITDMAVAPCACRTVRENCDNPINTCFGLNFYGNLKKKAGERAVSVEEALAVADMAHERNLIAVIESRVQKVTEPSRMRVALSVAYVYVIFMPGVWIYKHITGSKMHLMKSDPREKDIISTKHPGYIHGGEKYAEPHKGACSCSQIHEEAKA